MADELNVKETIINNLNKYAIPYESKTKRCLLIDSKHRPTIKWLLWIFTDAHRINHTEEKDKFKFRLEKDYLNISFI
tara:strand:- start:964 stop:1194 length:231 start_codon:yes stop_codon:yes gene_type:complete